MRRRVLGGAIVSVLLIGGGLAPAAGRIADHDPCAHAPNPPGRAIGIDRRCSAIGSSRGIARGDFNGDGFGDLAIGVPFEDVVVSGSLVVDAGAVNVIYGSEHGLTAGGFLTGIPLNQFWHQGNTFGASEVEAGDLFGSALASGDFNGDGMSDLAIGIAGEDGGAGALQVLFGSAAGGLTAAHTQLFRALQFGLAGPFRLGTSLAWGRFDGDANGDLAIAATNSVVVLHGAAPVLVASRFQRLDSPGPFVLAAADFTGDGLSELVVGTPLEGVTDPDTGVFFPQAGAVRIFETLSTRVNFSSSQRITQLNLASSDGPQPGDHFGSALAAASFNCDAVADLAIGVPEEDVRNAAGLFLQDAGAVDVVYASVAGTGVDTGNDQFWHQSATTGGLPGTLEAGDRFGAALAAADFNASCGDLVVGVPKENIEDAAGEVLNAGAINVIYGSTGGLVVPLPPFIATPPAMFLHENLAGIEGIAEQGDGFGTALSAWDFNGDGAADLAVGVPFKTVTRTDGAVVPEAGEVHILNGRKPGFITPTGFSPGGLAVASKAFNQETPGILDRAEFLDRFGIAVY